MRRLQLNRELILPLQEAVQADIKGGNAEATTKMSKEIWACGSYYFSCHCTRNCPTRLV